MANKKMLQPKLYIALWMALLVSLGVYYICFAPRDSEFSATENRTLAAFPAVTAENIFSGTFGQEIETYLLDRFPGRNTVISATNRLQSMVSLASHDEYLLIAQDVEDPLVSDDYAEDMESLLADFHQDAPETTGPQETQPATQPDTTVPVTEPGEDPPITEKPEASIEDFPETLGIYTDIGSGEVALRTYYRKNVAAVTAVLNKYAQLLPENGKLMFTVGPSSYLVNRYVNAEEKVSLYSTWDEMVAALSDDNVYTFDSAEIFSEAIRNGEYVSFRTDNHWTPRGAYLIYSQMAAQAGKTPCDYYEDFDITVEENFQGNYVRDNPSEYWNVTPDTLELLMPKFAVEYRRLTSPEEYVVMDFLRMDAAYNDRYTVYLSGPGGPWRYVECDNEETENCLVVTDSFGMTVIPFLTANYKQVHYYDPRYYGYSVIKRTVAEMIEEYDIQDIYVIAADFHAFDSSFLISSANWHLNLE